VSAYRDFSEQMLKLLYDYNVENPAHYTRLGSLLSQCAGEPRADWISRFAEDIESRGFADVAKVIGAHASWSVRLTSYGAQFVEDQLDYDGSHRADAIEANSTHEDLPEQLLPASDRMVPLNHNSLEYQAVAAELRVLREALHGDNSPSDERSRLTASVDSAITLWDSMALKLIQIRVGIIMTIQDASEYLKHLGKAVQSELILDAIKKLVKNAIGVDL
jgi:hypothetical protein